MRSLTSGVMFGPTDKCAEPCNKVARPAGVSLSDSMAETYAGRFGVALGNPL